MKPFETIRTPTKQSTKHFGTPPTRKTGAVTAKGREIAGIGPADNSRTLRRPSSRYAFPVEPSAENAPAGDADSKTAQGVVNHPLPECVLKTAKLATSYINIVGQLLAKQKSRISRSQSRETSTGRPLALKKMMQEPRRIKQEDVDALRSLADRIRGRSSIAVHPCFTMLWNEFFPPTLLHRFNPDQAKQLLENPNDQTLFIRIRSAAQLARDLQSLNRLFNKPYEKWQESLLVKKALIYACHLLENPDFRADWKKIVEAHGCWIQEQLREKGALYVDLNIFEKEEPKDPPSDLSRRIMLAVFCERYHLDGFTSEKPWLMPKTLSIATNFKFMTLQVPAYLGLDWSRNIPDDVIKIVQKRNSWSLAPAPSRLVDTAGVGVWTEVDKDKFIARYYELAKESPRQPISKVFAKLGTEFRVHAPLVADSFNDQGQQTRNRVMNRQLRRWGVPPFSTDPKLRQ